LEAGSQGTNFIEPKSGKDELLRERVGYNAGLPLVLGSTDWTYGNGNAFYAFEEPLKPGRYTVIYQITTDDTDSPTSRMKFFSGRVYYDANLTSANATLNRTPKYAGIIDLTEETRCVYILASDTVENSSGDTISIDYFRIIEGEYWDASGDVIYSSFIYTKLYWDGECNIPKGEYLCNSITMPDGTIIRGCGDASKLLLRDEDYGPLIKLGDRCTVEDVTLLGASEPITLPDFPFVPVVDPNNQLVGVTRTDYPGLGYSKFTPATPIPPGTYRFSVNITSDNSDEDEVWIKFMSVDHYSTSNIMAVVSVPKGEGVWREVTFEKPMLCFYAMAAGTVGGSNGYNISVISVPGLYETTTIIGMRHGVLWNGDTIQFGLVSGCRIERFTGGGIRALDTGTPVNRNLTVSDCFITNCGVGIYLQRNAEFAKICNNVIVGNWYGIINRGGNNYISNCTVSRNKICIQVDDDEGSNGGHGAIVNCDLNHSGNNTGDGYGLVIRGTGRMQVTNCVVAYGSVLLERTDGNVLQNFYFGKYGGIAVSGGQCSLISNCIFRSFASSEEKNFLTRTNNTKAVVNNCYTRTGSVVSWES